MVAFKFVFFSQALWVKGDDLVSISQANIEGDHHSESDSKQLPPHFLLNVRDRIFIN